MNTLHLHRIDMDKSKRKEKARIAIEKAILSKYLHYIEYCMFFSLCNFVKKIVMTMWFITFILIEKPSQFLCCAK